VAESGKQRQREEGKMLYIARISLIMSNLMKKTDFNTPTTSADDAEPKHYERSLLNCDVSGTETPVPLQEGAPVKVSCSSKHLDLPDVKFKNLSDPGMQPQKISDNLH
jgi:hypothetical protein